MKTPTIKERKAVQAVFEKFEDIQGRESAALDALRAQLRKLESLRWMIEAKIRDAEAPFRTEMETLTDYPDFDDGWLMHDDWTGCDCCARTGLPLHSTDPVITDNAGDRLLPLSVTEAT